MFLTWFVLKCSQLDCLFAPALQSIVEDIYTMDTNIPCKVLPKTLEDLLDSLVCGHELLSWHTKGGPKFIQICLRFETAAIAEDITERVVYRKVSQRRLSREANRAKQWRDNQQQTQKDMNPNHESTEARNVQTDSYAMSHMAGSIELIDLVNMNTSIGQTDSAESADQIIVETQSSEEYGVSSNAANVCKQTDASTWTDVITVDQECETDVITMDHECETDQSLIFSSIGVKCNICHYSCNIYGNRWKRCTRCDDYDICYDCRRYHARHKAYVHEFVYPDYGYCDSCGYSFEDTSELLFQCHNCEDYVLCDKRMCEGMHPYHRREMKKTHVQSYLSQLYCDTDEHGCLCYCIKSVII